MLFYVASWLRALSVVEWRQRSGWVVMGLLFCAAPVISEAQPYVPNQTYFGRSNYTEYIAGDLPLIFSAPHGGALTPSEIPNRVDDGSDPDFTTVTDSNTEQLALAVRQVFLNYFGHCPHVIICQLQRTKVDCNRSLSQGVYHTNVFATQAWNEFQNFINSGSNSAVAQSPRAFYIDLHGQGHAIQRLELGYLLTGAELTDSDATLNQNFYVTNSSERTLAGLVAANSGMTFSQLLRGSNSFGGLMASLGFPSVPSPTMPSPGNGTNPIVYPGDDNPYFDGGYNTAVHTSQATGGPVDGLQIESNFTGVRDIAASRTNFGIALAKVLDFFFTNYYGIDLRIVAPSIWNGGAGNWATAANWSVALPVSGNYLQFNGAGGAVNNNLTALTSGTGRIYSMIFSANVTGSYGVSGNAITLVAGVTNFSSFPHSISNALTLATNQTFAAAGGPLIFTGAIANAGFNLTLAAPTNLTLAGIISGSGGLYKSGQGILTLAGASIYSGGTTNLGGTLLVSNSTGSATGSGPVLINPGTTLAGSGIVGGPVTIQGKLSPGTTVGILTITNGLNFNGGSYIWTLAANDTNSPGVNYDQLALTGGNLTTDIHAGLSINFTNSATAPSSTNAFWLAPHTWKIIGLSGTATNPSAAAFNSIVNGSFAAGKFTSTADGQGNVLLNYLPFIAPVISPIISGAGTTNATITWSAVAGVNYQVQYSSNLSLGPWLPLGDVLATGTNAFLIDTSPIQDQRFYRIVIP